jgi:L-ribulose-5-phosphate 4-epimerase
MHEQEGVIKFRNEHTPARLPIAAIQRLVTLDSWRYVLIKMGVLGREPGRYQGAGFGNMSARIGPFPGDLGRRAFVITGSQTSYSDPEIRAEYSLVHSYDLNANSLQSSGQCRPSSESMTHAALYDLNPAIRYVFHGHSPMIWRQAKRLRLPTTQSTVAYGTPEMAFEMRRLYRESSLLSSRFLAMGGHEDGVLSFGKSAEEAGMNWSRFLALAHQQRGTGRADPPFKTLR